MFDPDVEMPITQSRSRVMSDFTIEQLEALKEGADSSPWRPEYDEGDERWVIAFDHPKFGGRWDKGIAHGEGAARLFAAAPALLDALIAEKQAHAEIRRRIEERIWELKQPLCSRMPEGDELDEYLEQWDRQSCEAEMLTRVLEGDDEGDLNTGGFPW